MNEQHFDALPPVNIDQQPDKEVTREGGNQPGSPSGAPATAPVATTPAVPSAADPAMAEDVDLIEKEWVEKAKSIVEQTKHDPYQQNEEMTRMKTNYLKKRYNRDIKISEA